MFSTASVSTLLTNRLAHLKAIRRLWMVRSWTTQQRQGHPASSRRAPFSSRALAAYLILYLVTGGGMLPAVLAETAFVNAATGDDGRTAVEAKNSATPWLSLSRALMDPAELAANNIDVIEAAAGTYSVASTGETFPLSLLDGITLRGAGSEHDVGAVAASIIEHDENLIENINTPLSNTTILEGFTLDGAALTASGSPADNLVLLSASFSATEVIEMSPILRNNEFRSAETGVRVILESSFAHRFEGLIQNNFFDDLEEEGIVLLAASIISESGPIGIMAPIIELNEFDLDDDGISGVDGINIDLSYAVFADLTIRNNIIRATGDGIELDAESLNNFFSNALEEDVPWNVKVAITHNTIDVGGDGIDIDFELSESESGVLELLAAHNTITAREGGIRLGFSHSESGSGDKVDLSAALINNTITAGFRGIELELTEFDEEESLNLVGNFTLAGNDIRIIEISGTTSRGHVPPEPDDGIFVQVASAFSGFSAVENLDLEFTIQNNTIRDAGNDGIEVLLFSSTFSSTTTPAAAGVGRPARRGDPASNQILFTIAGNTITGAQGDGIDIVKQGSSLESTSYSQTLLLLGNTVDGAVGAGVTISGDRSESYLALDRNELIGNVLINNGGNGFQFNQSFSNVDDTQLIASCNTITGNQLDGVRIENFDLYDANIEGPDFGGGRLSSRGFNTLTGNGLLRGGGLDLVNDAFTISASEGTLFAQSNYWGDNDPSDQVDGNVDFSSPLAAPPTRNVTVVLASAVTDDQGDPGLTPGDTLTYTATVTSNGDCGCASAEFNAPIPEGAIIVPGSITSTTVGMLRGAEEPVVLDRGLNLSDPNDDSIRIGLGALGYDEVIEITWQVIFGGCAVVTQADITCQQLGTILSNEVTDNIEVFDLSITKTDSLATAIPGTAHQYVITVGGDASCPVADATVTDTFPGSLLSPAWTCVGTGGATCSAAGSGPINDSIAIGVGEMVTYTVNSTIDPGATGILTNTATVDSSPGGARGLNLSSATDNTTLVPTGDLTITKTDNLTMGIAGGPVSYTIVASNPGPSDAVGVIVSDLVPAEVVGATWTCTATPGSSCTANGSGDISDSVDLLAGGSVTFVLSGTFAGGFTGDVFNTADVTVPGGFTDPNPDPATSNEDTDVTGVADSILAIPTLGAWSLGLFVVLLSGLALLVLGRRGSPLLVLLLALGLNAVAPEFAQAQTGVAQVTVPQELAARIQQITAVTTDGRTLTLTLSNGETLTAPLHALRIKDRRQLAFESNRRQDREARRSLTREQRKTQRVQRDQHKEARENGSLLAAGQTITYRLQSQDGRVSGLKIEIFESAERALTDMQERWQRSADRRTARAAGNP